MRGLFFDGVADLYDRARPGYPEALVDAVLEFARLGAGERALEIGCGTGQASRSFAARGLPMVCLEPGPRLAALARRRLAAFPRVEVREETFEAWPLEREAFGLVLAARSLHWVEPRLRYVKTARALRPGGVLALFRSDTVDADIPLDAALRAPRGPRADDAVDPRRFEEPVRLVFRWAREYDAATYADLLRTMSRYRDLPARSFENVRKVVAARGDSIPVRFETRLLMARRAGG